MSDLEALLGFSYFPLDVVLGRSQVTHSNHELFHIQKVLAVPQEQSLKEESLNYSTRTGDRSLYTFLIWDKIEAPNN